MRDAPLRDPALRGLDVHLDMLGDVLEPQSRMLDRPSKSFVRHCVYPWFCPSDVGGTFSSVPDGSYNNARQHRRSVHFFASPDRADVRRVSAGSFNAMVRIGWGYDIHRLHPGRETVLGGVRFLDFARGFDTHSDGDVVAHAIIDALAGALGLGSLGDHFSEDDPADQDARSIEFLERFRPTMARQQAEVINLDCTIFCAAPRIGPVASEMRRNIAAGLGCSPDRINVKGKTNDGFGPEGEGVAISATVLVQLQVRETDE